MNEENGAQENLNPEVETTTENQEEVVIEETQNETATEDVDILKDELAKAKELAQNQKVRAEKAEAKLKTAPKVIAQATPKADIQPIDLIALMKADVTEPEEIQEVLDYAKFKRISVSEALKSPIVKGTIAEKKEQRATAQATNTGGSKRGTSKVTDESLLSKANKGEVPESYEDMVRLANARMQSRKGTK